MSLESVAYNPPPPTSLTFPRSSLDSSRHVLIDSILKQLKIYSRQIQTIQTAHRSELQLLERLYYKGKNQHRAALFWRRIIECRKYGKCLAKLELADHVENFRRLFFGDVTAQNLKVLKGSWTHVPHERHVQFILKHLSSCMTLLEKTHERLLVVYRHLTLSMQTGAFIQLILTLAAIVSRLDALVSGLKEVVTLTLQTCRELLGVLNPSRNAETSFISDVACGLTPSHGESSNQREGLVEETLEDIGSVIARPATASGSHSTDVVTIRADDRIVTHLSRNDNTGTDIGSKSAAISREEHVPALSFTSWGSSNEPTPVMVTKHRTVKARKKHKDEIDDIFGF